MFKTAKGRHIGRPEVLKRHFHGPIRFPGSDWQWWLADDESAHEAAQRMDHHLQGREKNRVTTLRERKGRSIFRLQGNQGDFFAKEIALKTLRKRLGAWLGVQNTLFGHDHGSAEVDNTLTLDRRTRQGLEVLCLGEYLRGGIPTRQLLIQPWLDGWIGLGDAFEAADEHGRHSLLYRMEALLKAMHDARICHLDINIDNLMVSTRDHETPLRAIDCAKMETQVTQPAVSTALQIGKMLRELYGRDEAGFAARYAQARAMQRRIAGREGDNDATDTLLALSLRYRLSKNLSRRKLVTASFINIDGPALEKRVRASSKNTDMPAIVWAHSHPAMSDEVPAYSGH
ncbi:Lipopolysaccharide kinase (Kdo/WaaP) family protein [Kushneria avicenniae]|uniref:Lipopolysaccharide kinase (Kdo/WaaP) family protein n=1 Tax=Kushneria avicenniae TaxID=402385 RepID=A0A1I1J9D1_9GAMM|nr:lipopolysaccharide kinase InaA family protein [Kushneria avicenniae]SFC45209.1 Lipopolysaccharide kinase (Kdo/WaaP) family protein [Kushneria avicenniae]